MENINLTDNGTVVDVLLQTKLSTKTQEKYRVLKLVLATGGDIQLYLKSEQAELLAFMSSNIDNISGAQIEVKKG